MNFKGIWKLLNCMLHLESLPPLGNFFVKSDTRGFMISKHCIKLIYFLVHLLSCWICESCRSCGFYRSCYYKSEACCYQPTHIILQTYFFHWYRKRLAWKYKRLLQIIGISCTYMLENKGNNRKPRVVLGYKVGSNSHHKWYHLCKLSKCCRIFTHLLLFDRKAKKNFSKSFCCVA